jgi:hypothetical protein
MIPGYKSNECYSPNSRRDYYEAIAQARYVQNANKGLLEAPGGAGKGVAPTRSQTAAQVQARGVITSSVQWEVRLRGSTGCRADVVLVGPYWEQPDINPVGVVELKLCVYPRYTETRGEKHYADTG